MTAETGQAVKTKRPHMVRRRMLGTLAGVGAWSVLVAGMAPVAVADGDVRSKQWYLDVMRAEDMWKVTTGEGIKVAVIDTGVNPSTPSLKGQVLKGFDATGIGKETDDYKGHGTTMAELIAGTGKGGGLQGLAPGVKIIPMRISNTDFQNKNPVKAGDAEDAIRAAVDSDAQIISMSFGSDYSASEERAAAKYAESKGKLFFAAAGNNAENGNKRQYPASYPNVIGVASADSKGTVSGYSQHGASVDIASPGNKIPRWCDNKFQGYCDGDGGTSAATAIASASAALLWSAHRDWTANQVLRVLFETASRTWKDDERSGYLGHGLIRPGVNILHGKGDPGDPDINPLTNEKAPDLSGSPTPSPASSASAKAPDDKSGDKAVVAGSAEKADDSNTGLIIGGVAVVVVLAAGTLAVVRRRRSA
ncbi:S8 family serine peptidase [Streptomyces sp. NPDC091212]|uniref:S8 family serine peptidase n=1 Tax=Streptomyces sp. NPDC091212 TaxID=3155191 RepID=UPI00341F2739